MLPFGVGEASSSEPPLPLAVRGKPHRAHEVRRYALNCAACMRAYDYLSSSASVPAAVQFMARLNSHSATVKWVAVSTIFVVIAVIGNIRAIGADLPRASAFSVAACLCLDLDEQPMAGPPVYPRNVQTRLPVSCEICLVNVQGPKAPLRVSCRSRTCGEYGVTDGLGFSEGKRKRKNGNGREDLENASAWVLGYSHEEM